jgi:hypothetical protein
METYSTAPISPGAPSVTVSSGAQPQGHECAQEPDDGVVGRGCDRLDREQPRRAEGGDVVGDHDRFGAGAVVEPEVRRVQVQVGEFDVGQAARPPRVELDLDGP